MTERTEPFNSLPKTPQTHSISEQKSVSFLLLNIAPIIRAVGLLVGAGFFSVILLLGIDIALQRLTLSGAGMIMGFAALLAILISILTAYLAIKIHRLIGKIRASSLENSI